MKSSKILLAAFFSLLAFKASSQKISTPVPDSSVQNSSYDWSKLLMKSFRDQQRSQNLNQVGKVSQASTSSSLADPISIGITFVALKNIIRSLEATARTVTGDVSAHVNSLLATGNAVVAQWEQRLGDRLDRTIDELKNTERRIVEDTESLIRLMQQTVDQVRVGALETARVTAAEADILAYNITSIIKRKKIARFIYANPKNIRIGLHEPVVVIRGNFLDFKHYNFNISGFQQEITPLGYSANEVSVLLPDELLASIQTQTTIAVTAEPYSRRKRLLWFGYRYWRESPQTQTITLNPRIDYSIAIAISAQAKVPTTKTFDFNFYDSDENCDADRRIDRSYVLPPTWVVSNTAGSPELIINTANCGSGLVGRGAYYSGDNMGVVEARIKGCGYSWFGLNCNGRGWFGYTLRMPSKSYDFITIPSHEQLINVHNQSQQSFTIDYPLTNIPADNQGVKFSYTIVIQVQEGSSTQRIEISDVNPNVNGFRTRMTDNRLAIEIDPVVQRIKIVN